MGSLKIIECKGFTKEEAFANLDFDPNSPVIPGTNATQAWNKAGKPIPGTLDFKRFITQQLFEKTKNEPGYGIHIVLDPPIRDIRKRPYTIVNNKATGTREWKFQYWIREDKLDITWFSEPKYDEYDGEIDSMEEKFAINVVKPGLIVEICDNKAKALDIVKNLTTETHKSYSILAVKVPDIAPISAYCMYTPSISAKEGTFVACGINKIDEDDRGS